MIKAYSGIGNILPYRAKAYRSGGSSARKEQQEGASVEVERVVDSKVGLGCRLIRFTPTEQVVRMQAKLFFCGFQGLWIANARPINS